MNNKKLVANLGFFFASLLVFGLLFHLLMPAAKPLLSKADYEVKAIENFHYVALGDSLTQGVGDSTNQGGFVPLLAQSLENTYGYSVRYENYGVSGNTSQQILTRMKENAELVASLKKADLMTLTVGGNDLRQTLLKNILNLKVAIFTNASQEYSERLVSILELARAENPNLPIYVLGIYNPFYLNFPEMTEMQTIVDNWNQTTETTLSDLKNVYFVPINDLLYKGIDGKQGIVQQTGEDTKIVNDALYTEDNFHPNNTGYEIMMQAIMEKISETKENWK